LAEALEQIQADDWRDRGGQWKLKILFDKSVHPGYLLTPLKESRRQIKSDIEQEAKRNYLSPSASRRGSGYGNHPGGDGGLSVFFSGFWRILG